MKNEDHITSNKLLFIGETPGNPGVFILLHPNQLGNIYVYYWDFGLTKIAESFTDFINKLY